MPVSEAQKRAQRRYVEKNKERLAAYKAEYWQKNKHKYLNHKKDKPKTDPVRVVDVIEIKTRPILSEGSYSISKASPLRK